jgi:flagellar biosynthesis/type III secretory pathway protein FliH
MSDLTVADELEYDALPEETRKLCDKIIDARAVDAEDEYEKGYNAGRERGEQDADEDLTDLRRQLMDAKDRITALAGEVTALEDELAAERRSRPAQRAAEG